MSEVRLIRADCLGIMRDMPEASVDAIVTDPPAGISFMQIGFDNPIKYQSDKVRLRDRFLDFLTPRLAEALRVAKPGARMLCWSIPRTSHWTGTAIEDAGWIIEDRIASITGQGFPKAKSKLKPAIEDWWLARKPSRYVPELQIDACRVAVTSEDAAAMERCNTPGSGRLHPRERMYSGPAAGTGKLDTSAGRWPANLVLQHHPDCRRVGVKRVKGTAPRGRPSLGEPRPHGACYQAVGSGREPIDYAAPDGTETVDAWECVNGCPVRVLDTQSGERKSGLLKAGTKRNTGGGYMGNFPEIAALQNFGGDSGGASRFFQTFESDSDDITPFFYCSKASRRDRGDGNTHPTCKSTKLCEWLVKLITCPGGIVLDPFMGSGSIGIAAARLGFGYLGIESDPAYFAIAERRLAAARPDHPLFAGPGGA